MRGNLFVMAAAATLFVAPSLSHHLLAQAAPAPAAQAPQGQAPPAPAREGGAGRGAQKK